MKRLILLFLAVGLLAVPLSAQKKTPALLRPAKWLMNVIDTFANKGIDKRYIEVTERPWQVIVKTNVNQSELNMNTSMFVQDVEEQITGFSIQPNFRTGIISSVGLWAGYRGYGLGYMKDLTNNGDYFTFGALGGRYGVSIRYRTYSQDVTDVIVDYGEGDKEKIRGVQLDHPIRVKSFFADGYYLFNGKRFSYAAGYDMSTIQLRSAGSFLVGAMWFHSDIKLSGEKNPFFLLLMNGISRVKLWQGSIGFGYSYNFVPKKGWLINATLMPTMTFLNRVKIYRYDYEIIDHGTEATDDDEIIAVNETKTAENSRFRINFDARMSVTYNWKRSFINVAGQYNHFSYHSDDQRGTMLDWYVNASFGVRF